jgi:hypothetical protein
MKNVIAEIAVMLFLAGTLPDCCRLEGSKSAEKEA